MKPFLLALSFLTVLPTPAQPDADHERFVRSRAWFPLVGALLGLLWGAFAWGLSRTGWPTGLRGALLLALPLLLTGFLHLDGLLDCADALLAPCTPARRLDILKDVHMGAFAFGVGALWILVSWQLLAMEPSPLVLVAIPALSRGLLLIPTHLFPYARSVGATSVSGSRLSRQGMLLALVLTAPFVVIAPREALVILATELGVAAWAAHRLGGGITGDVYGLLICLSETSAIAAHVLWKLP